MIKNIEINKLFPHPQNPRKELGDLKELSESIKKMGFSKTLLRLSRSLTELT